MLVVVLALLEDAGEPEAYVLPAPGTSCSWTGICEACKAVSLRYPYWDGERCMSCAVIYPYYNW